jgi:hypothetical protein
LQAGQDAEKLAQQLLNANVLNDIASDEDEWDDDTEDGDEEGDYDDEFDGYGELDGSEIIDGSNSRSASTSVAGKTAATDTDTGTGTGTGIPATALTDVVTNSDVDPVSGTTTATASVTHEHKQPVPLDDDDDDDLNFDNEDDDDDAGLPDYKYGEVQVDDSLDQFLLNHMAEGDAGAGGGASGGKPGEKKAGGGKMVGDVTILSMDELMALASDAEDDKNGASADSSGGSARAGKATSTQRSKKALVKMLADTMKVVQLQATKAAAAFDTQKTKAMDEQARFQRMQSGYDAPPKRRRKDQPPSDP